MQVRPAGHPVEPQSFLVANPHLLPTGISGLLIVLGWVAEYTHFAWPSIGLFVGAILVGGWTVGKRGLRDLLSLDFTMNALMTIAVIGAGLLGEWSEGAAVAFLFGVSETLESYTMDRARHSLRALMDLAPKVARVLRGNQEVALPVEEIRVGDTLVVRPGEKIAMDGTIAAGFSTINQAAITGESMPVEKTVGAEVFAGTLNGNGGLEVAVTKLVEDSTFARIVHLVEEAQGQRAPTQTFVERFAKVYTPIVMALALAIALIPPLALGEPWAPWIYRALTLLVVSCPCALVVSTPVSIVSAISNGARNGVIIKGGAHLERAAAIRAVAFDKTGTLTRGEPAVTDVQSLTPLYTPDEVLDLAAAVESRSEHPIARAIIERARGAVTSVVSDFEAIVGRGARATVDGRVIHVGSPGLFTEELGMNLDEALSLIETWQAAGKTVMLVSEQDQLVGAVAVVDTPRESSATVVRQLKAAGVSHTVMLTGDNPATAQAIARALGLDAFQAGLMPHDKVEAIKALVHEHGTVAMVGDGVNDAPALAAASVGIAMGGVGTDVALETADIALMADDLAKLPFTIRLSRSTLRIIKQNIGIALALKLLAVAAVFPGWLTLWLAILADTGATVLVTLNGMRLLRIRP